MNDKQILVVEDDTELAATYKSLLEQQGCKVQHVSNGAAALRYLANKDVDAVLCDFSMPVLEGDLLYTSLEKTKPHLCERFIFVTGMAENPKFQPFINRNKERVLFKPVTVEQLAGALEKLPGWSK
jgi:two-component system NtrC family sensor kinase